MAQAMLDQLRQAYPTWKFVMRQFTHEDFNRFIERMREYSYYYIIGYDLDGTVRGYGQFNQRYNKEQIVHLFPSCVQWNPAIGSPIACRDMCKHGDGFDEWGTFSQRISRVDQPKNTRAQIPKTVPSTVDELSPQDIVLASIAPEARNTVLFKKLVPGEQKEQTLTLDSEYDLHQKWDGVPYPKPTKVKQDEFIIETFKQKRYLSDIVDQIRDGEYMTFAEKRRKFGDDYIIHREAIEEQVVLENLDDDMDFSYKHFGSRYWFQRDGIHMETKDIDSMCNDMKQQILNGTDQNAMDCK